MAHYYSEKFTDQRTSCTRDFAVALLLGRRYFDQVYPNHNPLGDPEEAHEQFMEWLDTSVFEEISDDLLGIAAELEDAKAEGDQKKIDACKAKLMACENTEAQARRYLRDIDDELANQVEPQLRVDQAATELLGQTQITLASLERWAEKKYGKGILKALPVGGTSEIEEPCDSESNQRDDKGPVTAKGLDSLYLTFGILIHRFVDLAKEANAVTKPGPNASAAKECFHPDGSINKSGLAKLIRANAKVIGSRGLATGQGVEAILNRLEAALKVRAQKLKEPLPAEPKITQ